MRRPGLSFLYRLECNISNEEIEIGAPHAAGVIRSIANIVGGTFKGPELSGSVLPLGGADWATVIEGTHVSCWQQGIDRACQLTLPIEHDS